MTASPHYPFVQAILADPDSHAPRLKFADWLESRDQVRAEAIRLGVQLNETWRVFGLDLTDEDFERQDRLEKLDERNQRRWEKALPKIPGVVWELQGGLFEGVYIEDADAFRASAAQIFDAAPATAFRFSGDSFDPFRTFFDTPELARLGGMNLGGHYVGRGPLQAMSKSPHLAGLKSLGLSHSKLGNSGLRLLARMTGLESLRAIDLERNGISSAGVSALIDAPHFESVEDLNLGGNTLGPLGAEALAKLPVKRLRRLDLSGCRIGPHGLRALVQAKRLEGIEFLDLTCNRLDDACFAELADSGQLRKVVTLKLTNNRLGEGALAALAKARLGAIRHLTLNANDLKPAAVAALAKAKWLKSLESLLLDGCLAGDLGVRALAQASWSSLRHLRLSKADVSDASLGALAQAEMPKLRIFDVSATPGGKRRHVYAATSDSTARAFGDPKRHPELVYLTLDEVSIASATNAQLKKRFGKGLSIYSR